MIVDTKDLISSYRIAPNDAIYVVILPFKHKTLKEGDKVRMVNGPGDILCFIRLSDYSIHDIQNDGEYIVVMKEDSK